MWYVQEVVYMLCLTFCLQTVTIQKEFISSQEVDVVPDDWSQMKWDSILEDSRSNEENEVSKNDPNNLDPLFSFEDEINRENKNQSVVFAKDEVFTVGTNIGLNIQSSVKNKPNEQVKENKFPSKNQHVDIEVERSIDDFEKINELETKAELESTFESDNFKQNTNTQGIDSEGHKSEINISDSRSFIFNPFAQPQEKFQNCSTPNNETGTCRYLQHCLIPTIIGSLGQFMSYVCIIEGRYIGVCCPSLPVSVVVVQDQKVENNTAFESNHSESKSDLKEDCGISTNTRIVGGSKADPKAWPWMVALLAKFRKRFFCGGALINDRYVLTAAHCTFGVFNNEIVARLGEYDFKDDGESHDEYSVSEIRRHAMYNRRTLVHDIALLKLEKPVVFNEFIKTICFPEEEKDYVGEQATLAGWGNIGGGGKTSDVLLEATFPVISNEECSEGHGLPIPESLICTGAEAGDKGACNGDSGGPLMLLKNNRWKVIGLVSWGRRGCNPEFPTVYTRVSYYLEWIQKHSK